VTKEIITSLIAKAQRVNLQNPETGRIITKELSSLELSPEELAYRHLTGSLRVGIYPEVEGGRALFGAVDLDLKDEPEEIRQSYALKVYRKLKSLGLNPFIEKSKSKGYHVWLFLSEPAKKELLRWVLSLAVESSGYPNKKLLEVFPKGTALFLPMFNSFTSDGRLKQEFLKEKRNAVLKPENLNQYQSNWPFLFKRYAVENTQTLKVLEKLKELPPCFLKAYENWVEGNRNGYTAGLAGVCKKLLGLNEDEAVELITLIAEAKEDEELPLREAVIRRTYEQDNPAGCSILKGESSEITVAVPACPGDCQLVRKLKEEKEGKGHRIITLSKFYPEPFAKEILSRFDFWYEGEKRDFWYYDQEEGIWKPDAKDFIKDILYKENMLDPSIKKKYQVGEIVDYIKHVSRRKGRPLPEPSPFLIPFKNGVYDLKNDLFRSFRKEDYFTFKLPWNYKEGAQCPLIDRVFHSLLPEDRVIDLYELVAYCLWRGYPYQKFFILYGRGSNGKGLYTRILTAFLGKENTSSVSLEELQKGGFHTASLYKKLANIAGEVSYEDLKHTRLLKQLTGEDLIYADRKNKDGIHFYNYAKLIFLTNQIPITRDTTYGFYRRVFLMKFPYQFSEKDGEELEFRLITFPQKEEYEGLAYKSIQVLKKLLKRNFRFTNNPDPEKTRRIYERLSNPVAQFIEEFCERDPEGFIWKFEFAERLNEWLDKKGFTKLDSRVIGKRMKALGYEYTDKRVPGTDKKYKAWIGIQWKEFPRKECRNECQSTATNCDLIATNDSPCNTYTKDIFTSYLSQLSQSNRGQTYKDYKEQPQTTCDNCDICDITTEELPAAVVEDFCSLSEEELKEFEELERELNEAKEDLGSYITEEDKAKKAVEKLKDSPVLYLDIETFSEELPTKKGDEPALDPFRNKVRLISLGDGERFFTFDLLRLPESVVKAILELISKKLVVGHNLKFDLKTLAYHYGKEILPQRTFDTYLAEKLIWNAQNPGRPKKGELSLKTLAAKYAGVELDKELQTSDWAGELSFEQVEYALNDVRVLPQIVKKQVEILNGLSPKKAKPNPIGLESPVARLEMAFLPVLVEIELSGVPVNEEYLKRELRKNRELFRELYTELKERFQIDPQSPKQLLNLLRNRLGLQVESTSNKELLKHSDNEVVAKVIKLRKAKKKADLIEKYLQTVNSRLYPEFNQLEAHSGRMSCRNPNVQQVPRELKGNFYKAPKGRAIIKADYPAIELRLAAVIAPDETMIKAFREGKDLHKFTASLVSGKPIEEITKEERQRAKALNFGFIYGMSAKTFKEYAFANYGVELTEKEAQEFREKFFNAYQGIARWHRKTADRLSLSGGQITVYTLMGRPIAVDKLTNALNSPVQGSGADMLKMAAYFFRNAVREAGIDAQIVNLVHDEIVVECSLKVRERAGELLKEAMEKTCSLLINQFKTEVEVEEVDCGEAE